MPDADKAVILELSDRWLWIVDDQLVHAPITADLLDPKDEKRVLELPPLARALVLSTQGKTVKALKEVETAVRNGNDAPELQWAKGQFEFELGRYEEALKSYGELLDLRPGDKAAAYNQAICQERLGRFEEAGEKFRRVLAVDPDLTAAHLGLGVSLLNLGRPAEAVQ